MAEKCDGVIVGSAIVKLCGQYGKDCVPYVEKYVKFKNIPFAMEELLFDPQTSGGLLMAVGADEAEDLRNELRAAGLPAEIVGEIVKRTEPEILVVEGDS